MEYLSYKETCILFYEKGFLFPKDYEIKGYYANSNHPTLMPGTFVTKAYTPCYGLTDDEAKQFYIPAISLDLVQY